MTKAIAGMPELKKPTEDSTIYEEENEKLQTYVKGKLADSNSGKYFKGLSTSFGKTVIDGTEILYLNIDFTVNFRGLKKENREEILRDVYVATKDFCVRNSIQPNGLFLTAAVRYAFDLIAFEETDESIIEIRPDSVIPVDRFQRWAFYPEMSALPNKLYYLTGD